jgi:Na+/proline symporter
MAAVDHGVRWEVITNLHEGALKFWASLLALALGDIVALDFMERVFAAKSPKYAKVSCILSGIITIVIGAILALLGIFAAEVMGHTGGANTFLSFIAEHLPVGISMMVIMALIAACISTIDGAIMASSVVVTKNIVQQNFPAMIPNKKLLLFSRLACIPVTLGSIIIAILRPVPGDLLILAFDVVFAGCLVPLAFGIYWKRATARAALWAVIVPSILRIVLHFVSDYGLISGVYAGIETLIPPIISCVILVCVSLQQDERQLQPEVNHA